MKNSLSPALLKKLRGSFQKNNLFKCAHNALRDLPPEKLTLNREKIRSVDSHFTHRLPPQKITDQQKTARCWMFAGFNLLRPIVTKKLNLKEFEFSYSFISFYDKLEKAHMFLENIRDTRSLPYTDRLVEFILRQAVPEVGQWVGLAELVKKYGVVPLEIMPDNHSSNNSRSLSRVLAIKLKEYAVRLRKETDRTRPPDPAGNLISDRLCCGSLK